MLNNERISTSLDVWAKLYADGETPLVYFLKSNN